MTITMMMITTTMTTTTMMTKYGHSKLALACVSFLAFAGLAAALVERQPTDDTRVAAQAGTVQEIATEDGSVRVPDNGPVTRTRGS